MLQPGEEIVLVNEQGDPRIKLSTTVHGLVASVALFTSEGEPEVFLAILDGDKKVFTLKDHKTKSSIEESAIEESARHNRPGGLGRQEQEESARHNRPGGLGRLE